MSFSHFGAARKECFRVRMRHTEKTSSVRLVSCLRKREITMPAGYTAVGVPARLIAPKNTIDTRLL